MSGVPVQWVDYTDFGHLSLDKYGTNSGRSGVTNGGGVFTMQFTPNTEIVPGFGTVVCAQGAELANFQLSAAYVNLPPGIAADVDAAYNIRRSPWTVCRHAPRGFKFDGEDLKDHACNAGDCVSADITYSGQVCGEDPYAQPWTFSYVATETITGSDPSMNTRASTFSAQFQSNAAWGFPGGEDIFHRQWRFVPGTSGNPSMQLTWSPTSPFTPDTSTDQALPVTEDMSCPAPTP